MPAEQVNVLQIGGDSVNLSVTGSLDEVAIPALKDGAGAPRWVSVSVIAGEEIFLRPGVTGVLATTTTGFHLNAEKGIVILNVVGCTHIGAISGGTGTLHVTPLANQ